MFKRKLAALGFHHPDEFNANDENQFRNFIIWLEDHIIRLYKIEDRCLLKETNSTEWPTVFDKYLDDLKCPVSRDDRDHVMGWLLSHGTKMEYNENAAKFNAQHQDRKNRRQEKLSENGKSDSGSLSEITGDNPDLKAGVASLSKLLGLPSHHDHITTLQAIRSIIEERLSSNTINAAKKGPNEKKKGKTREGDYLPITEVDLGFQINDSAVNEAAKIARLLHLHELRDVQTQINKAIVLVQKSTANPKTDQSLGKVGR
eukprot:Seg2065.3 transcript_id=Seg2065.3/GoldUCD/mRNA.D3Y31 product="RNA transcription translation and transport factor protein" protein_id=Seg2065.3/GoldUCD/D3Y31